MIWLYVTLAFLTGLSVCYWKRAWLMAHLPTWQRPRKEPVDLIAARLDTAVDRLEAVHADLAATVRVMQNGATDSDHLAAPGQRRP